MSSEPTSPAAQCVDAYAARPLPGDDARHAAPVARVASTMPRSAPPHPSQLRQHDCATMLPARTDALDRAALAALAAMTGGFSPASVTLAWLDWAMHLAIAPGKWLDLALLLNDPARQPDDAGASGSSAVPDDAAAAADPRFADPSWSHWPFCVWRDHFLCTQRWWHTATTGVPDVSRHHEEVVGFIARQWLDACSPSNFVALNPRVLETTARSGGANFAAGAQHWLEDCTDMLRALRGAAPARHAGFRSGHEVAITPGSVVWRNELCELLHYEPAGKTVAREPLFIVPSWIMKYYVLDLQPHNSLIRYMVEAGFTVYAVSWRNPHAQDRDLAFNDYLRLGVLEPLEQIRACSGGRPVHAAGYCLGGNCSRSRRQRWHAMASRMRCVR